MNQFIKKTLMFLLCIISIVSAITNTIYVKVVHDENKLHHEMTKNSAEKKLISIKNKLIWINCIFMWIFSFYTVGRIFLSD